MNTPLASALQAALAALRARAETSPQRAALIAGLVLPLAFAPFFLLPVFYLSAWLMLHLALAHRARPGFLLRLGWLFGFGQFFTGLLWMGEAFLVEAEQFLWALPFAVTLLPAGLALFPALAFAALGPVARRFPLSDFAAALLLALLLAAAAWLRSTVLTGLPWNLPGMVWGSWLGLAQPAAWVGVHGLSLLVLLNIALLFAPRRFVWTAAALPLAVLGVAALRLASLGVEPGASPAAEPGADMAATEIIIVQPDLAQRDKWRPELRDAHIDKTFRLTQEALKAHPETDLIIWPETAIPALIDEGTGFIDRLRSGLPARDPLSENPPLPYLLTGAVRRNITADGTDYYNSAMLWRGDGLLLARSDKHHLVPFGEYLPLQGLLEAVGLQQLTRLRGGYAAGPPQARLSAARLPLIAPLICYEAIFPALSGGAARPQLLANLTNDGWFGQWHGPHQHLAQARLRAVEQGVPLMRAANTGISAAFDGHGRRLAHLPLGTGGHLHLALPPTLPPTLYHRLGDWAFAVLWLAVFCGFLAAARSRRG